MVDPALVVFACVHSAERSQMAAALFNDEADPARARAVSAGTNPASAVHPVVIDAMREVGIDLAASRPQRLDLALAERAHLLITMGCGDACPYVPGLATLDWPLDDPKHLPLPEVRRVRDDIHRRVRELVADHHWRVGR